jgi:hypothetical protein
MVSHQLNMVLKPENGCCLFPQENRLVNTLDILLIKDLVQT